jgi:hypothetical protein
MGTGPPMHTGREFTPCSAALLVSYFWIPVVAPIAEIATESGVERFFGVTVDLDPPSVFGAVGFLIGVAGVGLVQQGRSDPGPGRCPFRGGQ